MTYVFDFDHHHDAEPRELNALLGGKGASLAEMTSVLGLPVPHGFTISTGACREFLDSGWPAGLTEEVDHHVARLQEQMGREIGDANDPLLVSVRSGAEISMPGMMDTVLNLGLNDRSVTGLSKQTAGDRFAYDCYRRFIEMYATIVLGLDKTPFDDALDKARAHAGAAVDAEIPADTLVELCAEYLELVRRASGASFPQDPNEQLRGAIEAVFRSWNAPRAIAYRKREHIRDDLGTAVTVQAMVFGNRNDRSGTGVGFTRDPATGENRPYGDFLVERARRRRRRGNHQHRTARGAAKRLPRDLRGTPRHLFPVGASLPGHVRHRIHDRLGQALDAPDAERKTHRARCVAHGRRNGR